jgi:signal transduction histidine kinase
MTDQSDTGQALADQGPASAAAEAPDLPKDGAQRAADRKGSRFALRNWRVSWRLIALIAIPTVTAMAFGGVRIQEAMRSASSYQRVETLAELGQAVTGLASAMEDERDQLAGYIAQGRPSLPPQITQAYHATNLAAGQVSTLARAIGPSYSAQVQNDLAAVIDRVDDLTHYRDAATTSKAPALTVIDDYSEAIADLFTLNDQIAQGSSDPTLANNVRALGALSRTEDQVTQQRGILYAALLARRFDPGAAAALTGAQSQQAAEFAEFQSDASIDEQQVYSDTVAGPQVDTAQEIESQAIASGAGANGGILPEAANAPTTWYNDMSAYVTDIRKVQQGLVDQIRTQSQALHAQATRTAILTGIEVLAVLIIVLMITIVVARSMVRPLRKLRTGALEVAGLRLPEAVRRMSETDGEGVPLEVEPIDVNSSDEIGEVARAFDQVHREALRLAANEAALRGNVNAMFVNLSRRSQSLVERQIRLIDDLEQGEEDPERLSSLFQMDHLATRMRRNSENLLVLAGHEESRRWNQPVALVDVLRAALSEIEQYERVSVNVQPGIAVRGQVVSDVVHLTAELIENATSFSPAETPVTIAGHMLSSGGTLLEITDHGVGMEAEEMAHANWRLDNPPVVDVAVSRRMGLFVVARLAARHGIRVRLRPAASRGLVALVWLPDEAITHEGPGASASPGIPEPAMAAPGVLARPVAEAVVTAEPGPGHAGWATTGPLPGFRTVPRPAEEPEYVPGQTGPNPIVSSDEESIAELGDESVDADSPVSAGPDLQITASLPFRTGEADYRSGFGADAPDGSAAESWSNTVAAPAPPPVAPMPPSPPPVPVAPVLPPAEPSYVRNRLPVFESVESDWFRQGVKAVARFGRDREAASGISEWSSPADEGWRAAATVQQPSSAGVTSVGLPKRVPRANLVPGAAGASEAGAPTVASPRSAAETRDRFARFQQGARRGRAAADGEEAGGGGDDPGHA